MEKTTEELFFDIVAEGERFYLAWAGPYRTVHERCHMTQITCPRLDAFSAVGLQFHYELHYRPEGGFVRLCCHYAPYDAYVGLSDDEVRRKLADKGYTKAEGYRAALAEAFKQAFAGRADCEWIAKCPDYLGLLRKDIPAGGYAAALDACTAFIQATYGPAVKSIEAVCR